MDAEGVDAVGRRGMYGENRKNSDHGTWRGGEGGWLG